MHGLNLETLHVNGFFSYDYLVRSLDFLKAVVNSNIAPQQQEKTHKNSFIIFHIFYEFILNLHVVKFSGEGNSLNLLKSINLSRLAFSHCTFHHVLLYKVIFVGIIRYIQDMV